MIYALVVAMFDQEVKKALNAIAGALIAQQDYLYLNGHTQPVRNE